MIESLKYVAHRKRSLLSLGMDIATGHRHDQELWKENAWHKNHMGLACIVTGGGGGITSEAG